MKKRLLLGAVLLSLLAVSCSKEQRLNNGNETETGKSISLLADISNGISTRLTCEDDVTNKELKFNWSDNESFKLYKGAAGSANKFIKTAKGNIFTGTIPTGGADIYYAVYGNNITNNNGELNVDISSQSGNVSIENGITTFMVAQAKDLTQAISFAHKLAVLKLNISFPDDITGTVSKVTVSGLHNKASYQLITNSYDYRDTDKSDITAKNGSNGFVIDSDHKITMYVAVFPEDVDAKQLKVKAYLDGSEYPYTIADAKTISESRVVELSVKMSPLKNLKEYYADEDYKTWTWCSENDELYTSIEDIRMYLGAGVYWDDGSISGNGYYNGNVQTYSVRTKKDIHSGLWLKKKKYINDFATGNANAVDQVGTTENADLYKVGRPASNEIGKYFFLPATGYYYSGLMASSNYRGYYWLSNKNDNPDNAYCLYFDKEKACLSELGISKCAIPLIAE